MLVSLRRCNLLAVVHYKAFKTIVVIFCTLVHYKDMYAIIDGIGHKKLDLKDSARQQEGY